MALPTETFPLNVYIPGCRYQVMLGVGGIGSGMFFALNGNHTLGREESRGGHFLDRRDYCKLHIISHYVKTLLGPDFVVTPIGRVGDDEVGRGLLAEMAKAGLDMRYVRSSAGSQTLFSFCFIYPDGSGGNMTTDNSACALVDPAFVLQAEPEFVRFAGRGIALAAPEVPLPAREKLLQLGARHRFFRVASFVAEEMQAAVETGLLNQVDLLAINLNEAVALASATAGVNLEAAPAQTIVETAAAELRRLNPAILISMTGGRAGSWSWDGSTLVHVPALPARVASTAGAGDAHLAGIIAGLVAGLALPQAHQLGVLVAALSVTSPHTINKEIDRKSLQALAGTAPAWVEDSVTILLSD